MDLTLLCIWMSSSCFPRFLLVETSHPSLVWLHYIMQALLPNYFSILWRCHSDNFVLWPWKEETAKAEDRVLVRTVTRAPGLAWASLWQWHTEGRVIIMASMFVTLCLQSFSNGWSSACTAHTLSVSSYTPSQIGSFREQSLGMANPGYLQVSASQI